MTDLSCTCGHSVFAHSNGCTVDDCKCKHELKVTRFNVTNHEYTTRPNSSQIEVVYSFTEKWAL